MWTDRERSILKKLLFSDEWHTLEQLIEIICAETQSRSKIADDQWGTLQNVLFDEGRVRGIREFVQRIHSEVQRISK